MTNNIKINDGKIELFLNIFEDIQKQFPQNELKTYDEFILLLNKPDYHYCNILDDTKFVGYFSYLDDKKNNVLWVDYLAIKKGFHSLGYGSKLFEVLKKKFKNTNGFFFEVEKEDESSPDTIRRANFYRKNNAFKLNINYFFPTKQNFVEMDLYYLPVSKKIKNKKIIFDIIKNAFDCIHNNISHIEEIYIKILKANP